MLWTVFYSGEADWVGDVLDFKVSIIFAPAVLCGVNEEKVKFTHDDSLSYLHYQSAFVAFCAFIYCFFHRNLYMWSSRFYKCLCSNLFTNSSNRCALEALDAVVLDPASWSLFPHPSDRSLCGRASNTCTSVRFPHLNPHFFLGHLHWCVGWERGPRSWGAERTPSCCPFLQAAYPWQRDD